MQLEEFTKSLEAEFEDMEAGTLEPDTDYRNLKGWSSMHALIIIAFVDINFDITLTAADLKKTKTVRELYQVIQEKQSA